MKAKRPARGEGTSHGSSAYLSPAERAVLDRYIKINQLWKPTGVEK